MIRPSGTLHDLNSGTEWDAATLLAEAARRAGVLQARGLAEEGGIFVIAHGNSPSFFADLFAVWSIGGCAACMNAGLTAPELARVVEFTNARAALSDDDTGLNLATATGGTAAPTRWDPGAPALILFTSGTTGDPKGVVQTFGSIEARLALNATHIGAEDMARTLCTLPTHFGHGLIGNCLTPLCHGGTVFIGAQGGIDLAARLGGLIDEHAITFLSSVPAFWKLASRMAPPAGKSLRRIHIGSAQLSSDLWRDVIAWSGGAQVVNMYGTTETANWIGGASSRDLPPEDGLLGTPWGGAFGVLIDGDIQDIGTGEIAVRTPSIMAGYHQRDDLTGGVMQGDWYLTGDIGTLDARGVLRLTGRARYMINVAGTKVYPEELDLLFERHPSVVEVCAFAIPDDLSGDVIGLAVVFEKGASVSGTDLLEWAAPTLRAEAAPHRVFVVDEIPKSPRGKVNRSDVAAQCLAVSP